MKIIISGATSMVGAALTNQLLYRGHDVIAIVRKNCKKLSALQSNKKLTIVEYNMSEYKNLNTKINDNIDVAIAMAWNGTRGGDRNNRELQQENFQFNVDFLHAVLKLGCKKFVTAGSQAEYGLWNNFEKLDENVAPNPNTEYGIYKLKLYEYAKRICSTQNCTLIEPRFFSLYGVDDYSETLVISTLKKMLENTPCNFTKCIQIWDFLYIDDAIDALCILIEKSDVTGIYNFGSGYSAPLKEFIEKMAEITQSKSKMNYGAIPYAETGLINVNPNVEKLYQIGWTPKTEFENGIKKIIEWVQNDNKK